MGIKLPEDAKTTRQTFWERLTFRVRDNDSGCHRASIGSWPTDSA